MKAVSAFYLDVYRKNNNETIVLELETIITRKTSSETDIATSYVWWVQRWQLKQQNQHKSNCTLCFIFQTPFTIAYPFHFGATAYGIRYRCRCTPWKMKLYCLDFFLYFLANNNKNNNNSSPGCFTIHSYSQSASHWMMDFLVGAYYLWLSWL